MVIVMRRLQISVFLLAALLFLTTFPIFSLSASAQEGPSGSAQANPDLSWREGVWTAPRDLKQMPIWPDRAPGVAPETAAEERVLSRRSPEAIDGDISQAVFDVTEPTITIYPPKGENTGAAIIVFPGGGFRAVVITLEGTEICNWIAAQGVTCILSKYRVPYTNHSWNTDCQCRVDPRPAPALQDAQRTIRLVRSMSESLGLDREKIGVMGFSAGGYLAVQTSNILESEYEAVDDIDQISSRPNFAISFFAGHLCRSGDVLDPRIDVTSETPPTFLVHSWDDSVNDVCNATLYARALDVAGVPTEVHLFATGGHAFGLRRDHSPDTVWPGLLVEWLTGIGILPDDGR